MADLTYEFLESVLNVVALFALKGKSISDQNAFLLDEMDIPLDLINGTKDDAFFSSLLGDVRQWTSMMKGRPYMLLPIRLRISSENILTVSTGYRNIVRKQIRFDVRSIV